jgi:hypothetical protein
MKKAVIALSIEKQLKKQMHRAAEEMGCPKDLYERVWEANEGIIHNQMWIQKKECRRKWIRGSFFTGAATVFLSIALVSSAFISPVMAETLNRIPLIRDVFELAGDLGLQTAVKKNLKQNMDYHDIHDGFTLTASEMIYDGLRVAVALHLDEDGIPTSLYDPGQFQAEVRNKGSFISMEALMNEEKGKVTWDIQPGTNASSVVVTLTGEIEGKYEQKVRMPESFNLTLKVKLEKIKEPFILRIPVRKNMKTKVMYPAAEKAYGDIRWKLKELELSPVSTRLLLVTNGRAADGRPMFFDLVDEKGHTKGLLDMYGTDMKDGYTRNEILYEPLPADTKTLTIRPYWYVFEDPPANRRAKLDENGRGVKEYIEELEIKVPTTIKK